MRAAIGHDVLNGVMRVIDVETAVVPMVVPFCLPVQGEMDQLGILRQIGPSQAGRRSGLPEAQKNQQKGDEASLHA